MKQKLASAAMHTTARPPSPRQGLASPGRAEGHGKGARCKSAIILVLLIAGCSEPGLRAGISIGPNGVRVTPVATANVGGSTVSIRP